jgi:RNA recognition motif-containing protein
MTLFVGNLHYDATGQDLIEIFSAFGDVKHARVVFDRETGRARGFGFVNMPERDAAERAISALDGAQLFGRTLRVSASNGSPGAREAPPYNGRAARD